MIQVIFLGVAAGSDGIGLNECKHPETKPRTKLCKRVGSMWASWRLQEGTWVNALLRDRELECPDVKFSVVLLLFTENLRLIESVSVKQQPLILGNALGLSDTVPGALFELVCHYYKPAVVGAYTFHALQWTLVGSTSYIGCNKVQVILWLQNNMKAISTLNIIYNYY